jgi:hypothetical protein
VHQVANGSVMQASEHEQMLADGARIREALGHLHSGDDAAAGAPVSWTELHDALTSLRAHRKAVPDRLTPADVDLVNYYVRCRRADCLLPARACGLLWQSLARCSVTRSKDCVGASKCACICSLVPISRHMIS